MKTSSFRFFLFASLFAAAAPLPGCAADTSSEGADAEESPVEEAAEELNAAANTGFFVVTRQDFRKCMSPMCGGVFVKRVNEAKTRCSDGSLQDECYVSEITLKGTGLSTREQDEMVHALTIGKAIVKARQYKKAFNGMTLGTLKGTEVWLGATGSKAEGTFFRAADNGVRCITTPCPSTSATELNTKDTHPILGVLVDRTDTVADADTQNRALSAVATQEGLVVAGSLVMPKCMAKATNCGPKVIASEFYFRVTAREGKACGSRGLAACGAGQFCNHAPSASCGAADVPGACAYRPEMCTALFLPVCGCDGKTYSNACRAAGAGVSVASDGACAANP